MYKFPKPGSFPHDSINHGEPHDDLIETIDRILDHHYFQERLSEKLSILTDKTGQNSSKTTNFEEDQYYKREDDLIE